ncbi:hypothetical protein ACJX0J_008612, partial [Zea mays]
QEFKTDAKDSETQYWKTLSSWKGKYLSFGGRLYYVLLVDKMEHYFKSGFGKMFGLNDIVASVLSFMPLKIKIFMWYILKQLLLVGASAICWAIWLSRNDVVFDKSPMKTFMQAEDDKD